MFLTDFADSAVTLPLAALVLAALLFGACPRRALAWAQVAAATFAGILLLKVMFGFWPALEAATGVQSPSGHTAGATIVYAGLVRLLGAGRAPTLLAAVAVAVAVGATRLMLGAHTPAEVVLGASVGLAGTAVLLHLLPPDTLAGARPRATLAALAMMLILALHGRHAPFEGMLQQWRACMRDASASGPDVCGSALSEEKARGAASGASWARGPHIPRA